jgi:hypothetical protein
VGVAVGKGEPPVGDLVRHALQLAEIDVAEVGPRPGEPLAEGRHGSGRADLRVAGEVAVAEVVEGQDDVGRLSVSEAGFDEVAPVGERKLFAAEHASRSADAVRVVVAELPAAGREAAGVAAGLSGHRRPL